MKPSIASFAITVAALGFAVAGDEKKEDAASEGEWIQLFNGENLDGWTPKIRYEKLGEDKRDTFRVADGMIQVRYENYDSFKSPDTGKEYFGHLFYETPYSHYRLRLEYRFVGEQCKDGPGWAHRNSGAMLHGQPAETMDVDQDFPNSIEGQLLGGFGDGKERTTINLCTPGTDVIMDGKLRKAHCTNSKSKTYHGEQWVTVEFEVRGSELIRHIDSDGSVVLEYTAPQLDDGTLLEAGTISLQSESHPCDFRKVELMVLEPEG